MYIPAMAYVTVPNRPALAGALKAATQEQHAGLCQTN